MQAIKDICKAIQELRKPSGKAMEEFLDFYNDILKTIPKDIRKDICKFGSLGNPVKNNDDYGFYLTIKDFTRWINKSENAKLKIKPISEIKKMVQNRLSKIFSEDNLDLDEEASDAVVDIINSLRKKEEKIDTKIKFDTKNRLVIKNKKSVTKKKKVIKKTKK